MQQIQVRSLGWEDPLEKEMATHSSILAWRIPWTEKPGGLTLHGVSKTQIQLREIHTVHSRGDQPWVFFGRNDAEAETPVFWSPKGTS